MTDPEGPEFQPYPIQLVAAFCVEARGRRKPKPDDHDGEPVFSVSLARTDLSPSGTDFSCRLTLRAAVVVGAVLADCRVVVQGDYRSEAPIDRELLERFMGYTPTVMLWPYARAYVGDLGRMLSVPLPPIPTLDAMPAPESPKPAPPESPEEPTEG